jgi:hypothetical protein
MEPSGRTSAAQRHRVSDVVAERPFDPRLPVPNLFIVGAAKAGTTSLHGYLSEHPEVFMSERKEPHYFASFTMRGEFDNFMPPVRDVEAYQRLFVGSEGRKVAGEASPSYLCDVDAARRIKAAIPQAKIIISLRNPVERAYSEYLMAFHAGQEKLSFDDALVADARREKGWGTSFQYVERGLYADQVQRYLDVFGRANVLTILFEELIRDTPKVMAEVAQFLAIDPGRFPDSTFTTVHNPFEASRGRLARAILGHAPIRVWAKRWAPQQLRDFANTLLFTKGKKPKMSEKARKFLTAAFDADLERLERLLERDIGALRRNR